MNTVQRAAVMAAHMRKAGHDVVHLSTALCPRDRDEIVEAVRARLDQKVKVDWTLVATSLMEAGVDFSFRTPFRERFATTSLVQIGGRGNRNLEWPEGIIIYDFIISHVEGLREHPAARVSADILGKLFREGKFDTVADPAELVTHAMRREMRQSTQYHHNELVIAERERRYPEVAQFGRVISSDTRLVVVDRLLRDRIVARDLVPTLSRSVQIWAHKIHSLGLESIPGRNEINWWPHAYDESFLGYMAGALQLDEVLSGTALIV
jgi:CRISPR-associated endonuclease/helicase Cas3